VQDLEGGKPRPITREGVAGTLISPDSKFLVCRGVDPLFSLCSIDGGESRPIAGLALRETPLRWSDDGRFLFVRGSGDNLTSVVQIYRLDASTGHRELWAEIMPSSLSGVQGTAQVLLSADGKSYVYGYGTQLSDLYLVEGLR